MSDDNVADDDYTEPDLKIEMKELRNTREVMHEFNAIVDLLETESVDKIVVTKSGKPRLVMISVEQAIFFQELVREQEERDIYHGVDADTLNSYQNEN